MKKIKRLNCAKPPSNDTFKEYQRSRLLTIKEVAQIMRVHRSTVSRYITSGELKAYGIGNRKLVKEEDLWLFIENRIVLEYVPARS